MSHTLYDNESLVIMLQNIEGKRIPLKCPKSPIRAILKFPMYTINNDCGDVMHGSSCGISKF